MRTVFCPSLDREVSALGFGCAALGSRVSEAQGRRALDFAFEKGVTWFDVAPPYGDGEAESILGKFSIGRRDRVVICTNFGAPRTAISPLMRILRPIERAIFKAFPELRGAGPVGRSRAAWEPLRGEQLEASVVESLRRLRTDYIDALAVHEPSSEERPDPAVLDACERIIEKGYVKTLSIAGKPEAIEAARRSSSLFQIAQIPDSPFEQTAEKLRAAPDCPSFIITHSLFSSGAYNRLSHLLVSDGGRLASLSSQLGYGPLLMASEMLLDYAFSANPAGVVLIAMFNQSHIEQNCARASRPPRNDIGPFLQKFFIGSRP